MTRSSWLLVTAAGVAVSGAQDILTLPPTVVLGDRLEGTIETGAAVLSPADVDFYQVESLQDLSGVVPNLYVTHSDTRGYGDNVSFRGQGNTVFFSPPSVGHYVDDVPSSDAFAYPSEFLGLERVLVHRGPQGSGFGRNGAAGMVEVVTARPTETLQMNLGAEYGSYDYYGFRVGSSGPLGGDFSHTLQFYYNERDGYVNNITLGKHTDDREAMGVLANLYWTPCDDVEWRLRVLAERARDGSQRLTALPSNSLAYLGDRFTVASGLEGETSIERYQLSLHGRKDFEWGTLKSISSYQHWKLDPSTVDLDLTDFAFAASTSRIEQDQTYVTHEFRLESPDDDSPLAWRAGLFLSGKDTDGDAVRTFPGGPGRGQTLFEIDETNVAGLGRLTYRVNERVTLEGGARVEYVDTSMDRSSSLAGASSFSTDDVYFSPSGGVRYALNDTMTLYATSGLGIKPAGFSAFSNNPLAAAFDEEEAWANEIGIDVRSRDGDWSWALRGFWNEIDDYQLNRSVPNSTDFIVVNADEVSSRGVEAEFRWRPVSPLLLQAAVGYQDTGFDSYFDPYSMSSYDDNKVPFVPEFTATGGFRYDFPRGFFVGSSVRLVGKTYYDAANDADFRQDAYTVWDAQAGYARDGFSIAVYGRNLLDEEYYGFINDQIYAGSPGDPQTFGVRVAVEF